MSQFLKIILLTQAVKEKIIITLEEDCLLNLITVERFYFENMIYILEYIPNIRIGVPLLKTILSVGVFF